MSATSGRDVLKNGELQGDLDAKGYAIKNADLSQSTTTPPNVPSIASTSSVLKGDTAGNAVAATAKSDYWDGTVFVASGATHAKGLVPDPGAASGTAKFLREDASWATPTGTQTIPTIASTTLVLKGNNAGSAVAATLGTDYWATETVTNGSSHTKGLAPDPGSGTGTTKFLREDGQWQVPPAATGVTLPSTTDVIIGDGAGGGADSKWALTAPTTLATLAADADSCVYNLPDITTKIGFRHIPHNSQSAPYTTVLTDSGKCIFHPASDANARTFTIDSNANVPYPIGTVIEFINRATANNVTIAITADTLTFAGAGTTGSRTLAPYGRANAEKIGTTEWMISGVGLT